jgi:hypothetical protein
VHLEASLSPVAAKMLDQDPSTRNGYLLVGANLAHNCRLTELRVWACVRKVRGCFSLCVYVFVHSFLFIFIYFFLSFHTHQRMSFS